MTVQPRLTRGQRRRGRNRKSTAEISPYARRSINLLYVPALLLFAVLTIYPFINGIALSFTNWNGFSPGYEGVGFSNYVRLFSDNVFQDSLINTFIYGFGSTIIQQVLGLSLAVALDRAFRGRNVARAIIYLPVLISPVVMGTMYYLLFSYNYGGLNDLLELFGGDRQAWLSNPGTGVLIIVLVNSLQFVGISMVIYLAGLQSIPSYYTEAAMLDGASPWQRFRHITLPLLQPAFATSIVLNLIGGLKLFDVIKVLTGGGPGYSTNSVSTLISVAYFDNQSAGYAAAMGVVLFLVIAVFTFVLNGYFNSRRLEGE